MIKITNLSKEYSDKILFSDLSFSFEKGILLIEGPSGCGKSTLIDIIQNPQEKTAGEISFPDNKNKISYCGNKPILFQEETLRSNLKLLIGDNAFHSKSIELLKILGIFSYLDKKIYLLSGGERKKAELFLMLLREADIYILDECLACLDKKSQKIIIDILKSISQEKIVIIIEHIKNNIQIPFNKRILFKNNNFYIEDKEIEEVPYQNYNVSSLPKNSTMLTLRNAFKARKWTFILFILLLFVAFLFMFLSFVFSQPRSERARENTILQADPFPITQVQHKGNQLFKEIPDEFIWSLNVTTSNGPTTFIASLNDDKLLHYSNTDFCFDEGDKFYIDNKEISVSFLTEEEISLIPDTFNFALIRDSYLYGSITLCSQNFMNYLLFSNDNIVSEKGVELSPEALLSYQNGTLSFHYGMQPIIVEENNIFSLPNIDRNTTITLESVLTITTSDCISENNVIISKDIYLNILLASDDHILSFYVDKEYFMSNIDAVFSPVLFVNDYSYKLNTYAIIFLIAAIFSFFLFLLCVFILKKSLKSWLENIHSIIIHANLKSSKLKFLLIITFPLFLIAFTLGLTLFPYLANLFSMLIHYQGIDIPSGYYYYSLEPFCPYYDNILTPIPLFTGSPYSILFVFVFVLVILLLVIIFRNKNRYRLKD